MEHLTVHYEHTGCLISWIIMSKKTTCLYLHWWCLLAAKIISEVERRTVQMLASGMLHSVMWWHLTNVSEKTAASNLSQKTYMKGSPKTLVISNMTAVPHPWTMAVSYMTAVPHPWTLAVSYMTAVQHPWTLAISCMTAVPHPWTLAMSYMTAVQHPWTLAISCMTAVPHPWTLAMSCMTAVPHPWTLAMSYMTAVQHPWTSSLREEQISCTVNDTFPKSTKEKESGTHVRQYRRFTVRTAEMQFCVRSGSWIRSWWWCLLF